jgi:ribose transport system ATP-binding protein
VSSSAVETSPAAVTPVLRAARIGKAFAGVSVLHSVGLDVFAGEIHALMGENGAGKSTLMKILSGIYGDYDGTILVDGAPRQFAGVRDAEEAGIGIIHQELNLVPGMTVAENIFLGREPLRGGIFVDGPALRAAAARLIRRLGIAVDPDARVGSLRVGEQQLVEIAKALSLDTRILIMDEPTSALSQAECATLFAVVRQLARDGVAVVYISHRMDEVMELADRVTILRDGRHVVTAPIAALTRERIIAHMVGRELAAATHPAGRGGADGIPVLSVRDLSLEVPGRRGGWRRVLDGVGFDLQPGEILGIAGLLGAGRTEILETIFGSARGRRGGSVRIDGAPVAIGDPAAAKRHGLALVTEDRKVTGLLLGASIRDNLALPSLSVLARLGLRRFGREAELARGTIGRLGVRCIGPQQPAGRLSGGNQQKVVIGKWLATAPRVLLLDEPTRGIDVGAKKEIYDLVFALADQGIAVLLVSSELPELLLLADRILVMCEGRQTGLLPRAEASQEAIMDLASPRASRPVSRPVETVP